MAGKQTAPYGSWKSPITSDLITKGSIRLVDVAHDSGELYFVEARPSEKGRNVVMKRTLDGQEIELTPAPFNVRTRVHEYGGGAFTVHDGMLIFSNFDDNLLYARSQDGTIKAITHNSKMRYADGIVDERLKRWFGVREDHTPSDIFAVNTLVSMNLDGTDEQVIVSGNDFYSNPRISPDGRQICWLTWNHPNMPWDETELWVANVTENGSLENSRKVAGGHQESIIEPVWSPTGELYFVSDRSNWWNLMRVNDEKAVPVCPMAAEFGSPSWVFGIRHYTFIDPETIVCSYYQDGLQHMARLNVTNGNLITLDSGYTDFSSICCDGEKVLCLAASPTAFTSLISVNVKNGNVEVLKKTGSLTFDKGYLSVPESIEFPTEHGKQAYAIYYPPQNLDYIAPAEEKPPLLVHVHGGPTSASAAVLSLSTQYWTSRGFCVVDVNYGGSSGYGREYRDRLKGQWGIIDVDDSVNAALYLVKRGSVDPERIAIAGGSAGGYTTLAALTFRDVFRAGASHFGLSELEVFAKETHKFESRYMDSLLGPYPEAKDVYYNRSPINFTDQLSCPVIFFQGLDDKIVPPNQAELMVDALRKKGLPVAYLAFAGEGHGFRMAENIKRSLDGEFYFYSRVFGFTPAEALEPVEIENL